MGNERRQTNTGQLSKIITITRIIWNSRWILIGTIALLVGVGVLVVGPARSGALASALPYLLLLACPLMMVVMMGSMNHSMGHSDLYHGAPNGREEALDAFTYSSDDQIRALRDELTRVNSRQDTLRQDLEHLEAVRLSSSIGQAD